MGSIKKRNLSLDVVRCLAIIFVVMIHVSAVFVTYSNDIESPEFRYGVIFDVVSRIGVPLFVMISGALLLDENRHISMSGMFKRIKTFALLLIIWSTGYSFVYQIVFPILSGESVSVSTFVECALFGHYHLWYLYMMIGLYFITPFLRSFTKKENQDMVRIFIIVSIAVQFVFPTLQSMFPDIGYFAMLNQFTDMFKLDFFFGYTTYYLLGWYIINIGFEKTAVRYGLYVFGIISLCINAVYILKTGDYDTGFSNLSIFTLLYAAAVFVFITRMDFDKLKSHTAGFVVLLSNLSFGIYVIHPFILKVVTIVLSYSSGPVIYMIISYIITFVCSFVMCKMVSKIPYIKKMIHC